MVFDFRSGQVWSRAYLREILIRTVFPATNKARSPGLNRKADAIHDMLLLDSIRIIDDESLPQPNQT